MKNYLLHYRQTIDGKESKTTLYWRCDANDYDHAVEQLKDEVEHAQGEKVVFVGCWMMRKKPRPLKT